ncbi:MAG TPA: class I SAM-dependent methyltransferase, partial [Solirubrobacteraceae bacterium]
AFDPALLSGFAKRAGFTAVRVRGEELLANWFGWTSRTLEASANPDEVPYRWKLFAYRGYLFLQDVDRRLLEPRLPPAIFYNLILSARKPA